MAFSSDNSSEFMETNINKAETLPIEESLEQEKLEIKSDILEKETKIEVETLK